MTRTFKMTWLLWLALYAPASFGQTAGTVYKETLAGAAITGSPFATLSAAQAAATAHGAGSYTITPYTTAAGAATTFVVSAAVSPSGTTITAPSTATISALGGTWGISSAGQVTFNGTADATTQKVAELAWVNGELWQESTVVTPARWWGTTVVPASWLPAGGTATSPVTSAACGAAPASTVATIACPSGTTGSWTQTTTYASAAAPVCWTPVLTPTSAPAGACTASTGTARPSYNTGNGLYVVGGRLYNIDGTEFRIRGVDRAHYDSGSFPGITNAKANAMRVLIETTYGASVASLEAVLQQAVTNKVVPIPVNQNLTTSGSSDPSILAQTVQWWVTNASTYTAILNRYGILNIANEWGSAGLSDAAWAAAYEAQIPLLRKAGYTGPLMIDANRSGQSVTCFPSFAAAILASDPQRNILFDFHMYGVIASAAAMNTYAVQMAAMRSQNIAFIWGEFGPGNNIGPSPTLITPDQVIAAAETNGFGWIGWAWDDNNLGGGASNNSWFSMTLSGPGTYTGSASQLTTYGVDVVEKLQTLAAPATIF